MTILCGTDFSDAARQAVRAASSLAGLAGEDLCLAHVLDLPLAFPPFGELDSASMQADLMRAAREQAGERLAHEAAPLVEGGVRASTELRIGHVDHALLELADERHASCVVIGAVGTRSSSLWKLGSHADRVAQTARVPVVVVRDAEPFESWARKERPLRVLVALDRSPTCEAALRWTERIARLAPAKILGAHVYWPPDVARRSERSPGERVPTITLGAQHPGLDQTLAREFGERLEKIPGGSALEVRFVGGLGRPADHLVEIAGREGVDLMVVGSHRRGGLSRFWHGSVSRGVIDLAPMSVACVPTTPSETEARTG